MRTLLKEPLLHFTLVAAVLFAAYSLMQSERAHREQTIYVSAAALDGLAAQYAAETGTLPGSDDMRGLVANYVRREALAREARGLGLDTGDAIIDHHLEQKMAFMVADLVDLPEPEEDTLIEWFQANSTRFETPERITFDHVFFRDPDDPRLDSVASNLAAATAETWGDIGDPFILQKQYADFPVREVARLFGVEFVRALSKLAPDDAWQGAVQSAHGTHFVRLTHRTDATRPEFDIVRGQVLADWQDATRRRLNEEAIQDIVDGYTIVVGGGE
ncbi:MAG: peptidylprolyl isomerase [Pseudomonadota bacterium]